MKKYKIILLCFLIGYFTRFSLFAQRDTIPIYLNAHIVTAPFFVENFQRAFVNSGILLSVTDNKLELQVGLLFDFNTYYTYEYLKAGPTITSRFNVILIPVFFNYYFSEKKFTPFISIGILGRKRVKANTETPILSGDILYENMYSPFQIGIGGSYSISKKTKVYMEPFIRATQLWGLLLGVSYNINTTNNK